ncbi:MAG: prepilin-type N-terminal cleavage/methylation domain-containing protein [Actinomycetota bacterium]|nr:prepilin-type N-terminal cleavage/methylation domain-containing protein [Actinomycetota bacterium]
MWGRARRAWRRLTSTAEQGWTLVEMLVVLLVFSLVLAAVAVTMNETLAVTSQAVGAVTGTTSANTAANALIELLDGAVYPNQALPATSWAVGVQNAATTVAGKAVAKFSSPILVACPDVMLFLAYPPHDQNVSVPPVWVFAFLTPPTPTNNAETYSDIWDFSVVTFNPGGGGGQALYRKYRNYSGCGPPGNGWPTYEGNPATPGDFVAGNVPTTNVDTTTSFNIDLNQVKSSVGGGSGACTNTLVRGALPVKSWGYNRPGYSAALIDGQCPADGWYGPPSAFGYVDGYSGRVCSMVTDSQASECASAGGQGGTEMWPSSIVAVRVYISGGAAGTLNVTTTAYQTELAAVVDNPGNCMPYGAPSNKVSCSNGS